MSLTRQVGKNLVQAQSKFQIISEMVGRAVDPDKPSLTKSLGKNRDKMDTSFEELNHAFSLYKRDELQTVTEEEFNRNDDEDKPVFEHNDAWFDKMKNSYFDLVEKSDEKLESVTSVESKDVEMKSKQTQDLEQDMKVTEDRKVDMLRRQIDNMKQSIDQSVNRLIEAVDNCPDDSITPSQTVGFQKTASDILGRLEDNLQRLATQYVMYLKETEIEKYQESYMKFVSDQTAKLDTVQLTIVSKTMELHVGPLPRVSAASSAERVMLKKVDPPKFTGEILDFPDFQRHWKASVGKAKFGEEAELDRLRDNVPKQASKMLIGETSMTGAWKTLNSLYGNKTLLANKLKSKLKNLNHTGLELTPGKKK